MYRVLTTLMVVVYSTAGVFAQTSLGPLSTNATIRLLYGDADAFNDTTSVLEGEAPEITVIGIDTHREAASGPFPTVYLEYAGMIGPDADEFWFTSSRPGSKVTPDQDYSHDLWRAPILDLDSMTLGPPTADLLEEMDLNTNANEGSFWVIGSTLIYTGCNYQSGRGDCDLYFTDLSAPEPVIMTFQEPINTAAWESHPALARDGTLFFCSNRGQGPETNTHTKLYMCTYDQERTKFSEPTRLPDHVNRGQFNTFPVPLDDGRTLMYCSGSREGGSAVYITQYNVDANGVYTWAAPRKLPEVFTRMGPPLSLRFHRVSGTVILAARAGEQINLYALKLPQSF